MSDEIVFISKSKLTNIANALRTQLGTQTQYTLDQMVTAINTLGQGGGGGSATVPVTGITISSSITVVVNSTATILRTITPTNASNKNIIWQIADNQSFIDLQGNSVNSSIHATLSSNGVVTGNLPGTCYVKATTEDGGYTDICTVTVVKSGGGSGEIM